jgi:hypothetical protein
MINMVLFDLILIKINALKKGFTDEYGYTSDLKSFNGEEYVTGIYLNDTNVYVNNCIFSNIVSTSFGGAILSDKCVSKLLVEQSSFIACKTSNSSGGGVFFVNTNSGQCVMSKICAFNCSTTLNITTYGQFAYIVAQNNLNKKNHLRDSSVAHTLKESKRSEYTVTLSYGGVKFESDNISNNDCSDTSAFHCSPTIYGSSYVSYSSIVNNTAINYGCIFFTAVTTGGASYSMTSCNILNNEQYSSDFGTIMVYFGSLVIKDSCILGNNNEKTVFYKIHAGSIQVTNCTIDNDKYAGSVSIDKDIENTFFNPLSYIVTEICDYYYGEYWNMSRFKMTPTMTPVTPAPTLDDTPITPAPTLKDSPIPTWDGEWAEEPEVVIKIDDFPIIRGTHYPLQTDYVRTSVSSVTAVTSISAGAVATVGIVVISLYNFISTAKKLTNAVQNENINIDTCEANSEDYIGPTSFSNYST